jgi:hypothetical protein
VADSWWLPASQFVIANRLGGSFVEIAPHGVDQPTFRPNLTRWLISTVRHEFGLIDPNVARLIASS